MNHPFRNPHTFDIKNYYSGLTCVIGGRDYSTEAEKSDDQQNKKKDSTKQNYNLDWSFLKSIKVRSPRKPI
jgi:hypothetical protein